MKNKVIIHGSQYKDNFGDTLLVKVIMDNIDDNYELYSSTASDKVSFDLNIKRANLIDMISAKYFIYGGGGYFGQPNNRVNKWSIRFIIRHGIVGIARRVLKKKYAFFGTGFGPLTHPLASKIAGFILKGADIVNLRDKESVQFASRLIEKDTINETADLVPYYISNNYVRKEEKKIILHMHLPVGDESRFRKIVDEYLIFRDKQLPEHEIVIISDSEDDIQQTWFFEILKSDYQEIKLSEYSSYNKTIEELRGASFVVTNKLHVAIVASSMKIPVASIYMHNKTLRYFEQLNRVGSAMSLEMLDEHSKLTDFFAHAYNSGLDIDAIETLSDKSELNIISLKEWCKS